MCEARGEGWVSLSHSAARVSPHPYAYISNGSHPKYQKFKLTKKKKVEQIIVMYSLQVNTRCYVERAEKLVAAKYDVD